MKHLYTTMLTVALSAVLSNAHAQGIYFDPDPIDPEAPSVTLYVDITSPECACHNLADADQDLMPLHIWIREPVCRKASASKESRLRKVQWPQKINEN